VVIGGGGAGTLTAARLLDEAARRRRAVSVTVVEPRAELGRGVAFSAADGRHLLNVPAFKMSAYPEDGGHFLDWMCAQGHDVDEADFVPRQWFGRYLEELLAAAELRAGRASLNRLCGRVVDLSLIGERCRVMLDDGDLLVADAVVLALGHLGVDLSWAPAALRDSSRFVADPWQPGALDAVPSDGDLLLVGTGLTMVDVLVAVDRPDRVVHAVSRHGAFPHSHSDEQYPPMEAPEFSCPTPDLAELRAVMADHIGKAKRRYGDWRPAVDSIRPITQRLWGGLSGADREEFARQDARHWDAMRHRIPPASARRIQAVRDAGRLVAHTGEVVDAAETAAGVRVTLTDGTTVTVAAVVNCTGPCDRPERSDDPLVRALLERGLARPGPLGIGFDTAADGRLAPAGDLADAELPLWTLGALRKGSLWESTAMPEIREQAVGIARSLVGAAPRARRLPTDQYGEALTTTTEAAAAWCRALDAVRLVHSGAEAAITAAVELDPSFAMGHAALALLGREWDAPVDMAAELRAALDALRAGGTARERSFVHMVRARLTGSPAESDRELLRHVEAYPRDCLAVSVAVPTIAFSGLAQPVERSWALVEGLAPSYGDDWWFGGLLAFVRQEQERWAEAESLAVRALDVEPASGHAVHARTHVFYETGEHRAGLAWLDGWINDFGPDTNHRAHFSWHAALHEIALDDIEAVRRRYADQLQPPTVTGARALVDSASLLWRLRMVGEWPDPLPIEPVIACVDECVFDRPATPFVALHAVVGLAAAGDLAGIERLRAYASNRDDPVFVDLVAPLCSGFLAVAAGQPSEAVEPLTRVVGRLGELGGSAAQQEVVTETLLYALAACGRPGEACAILERRLAQRGSPSDSRRLAALTPRPG
jgi:uncharacterized NAD(P)/FAD-binding protein YdhS